MVKTRFQVGTTVPVLKYSFGFTHWGITDLQQFDRGTRKLLIMPAILQQTMTNRTFLAMKAVGEGERLQQIEMLYMYKSCIVGLDCYVRDSSYPYMQIV